MFIVTIIAWVLLGYAQVALCRTTETIQDQTRLIYRTEQRAQVNMVTNIDTTKDHGDKNTHRSNQYKYLI